MAERDARSAVVLAHPSPDLYGSDRMLVESVRALVPGHRVIVTLPAVKNKREEAFVEE